MKLERVKAAPVRQKLQALDLERMDGANNPRVEFWVDKHGIPYTVPYFREGDRDSFVGQAVQDVIKSVT